MTKKMFQADTKKKAEKENLGVNLGINKVELSSSELDAALKRRYSFHSSCILQARVSGFKPHDYDNFDRDPGPIC